MKSFYIAAAIALFLCGCETPKSFTATNGSRADGTVELSYKYGGFQTPVVDDTQTYATAKARCVAWGYQDAQPFGAQTSDCQDTLCDTKLVTVRYQCLGTPH